MNYMFWLPFALTPVVLGIALVEYLNEEPLNSNNIAEILGNF